MGLVRKLDIKEKKKERKQFKDKIITIKRKERKKS